MISLIQLVKYARVTVNEIVIGEIEKGILAFIGFESHDTEISARKMCEKVIRYRIFPDDFQKTNLSLCDVKGGLLLVPQFTLVADTEKGLRPGFSKAMSPSHSEKLFKFLTHYAKSNFQPVATGRFGADMAVELCNDGPITFILSI